MLLLGDGRDLDDVGRYENVHHLGGMQYVMKASQARVVYLSINSLGSISRLRLDHGSLGGVQVMADRRSDELARCSGTLEFRFPGKAT